MRGQVDRQQSIFVVFDLEQRVPMEHPLRKIKRWPNWDDSRGINFRVGHVIMAFDVIEADGIGNARLLV